MRCANQAAAAALAVLVWGVGGCNEIGSGGSSAVELNIGTPRSESIEANGTNKYEFTTDAGGDYLVTLTNVSTFNASALDLRPGSKLGSAACISLLDEKSCGFGTLNGDATYSFSLAETAGEDTTFTILVDL